MKSKSLKIAIAFCAFFLSINVSLAFDDLTTHPALTDEIVDFHNLFSSNKITPEEKELIVSGAMGEDIPPRWINHFYDPIRNIGWTGRNTGIWPTSLVRYFSGTVLSSAYPVSSLNWLHNQELQTYYKMYKGNRTWERAVYEYANGNPQEALYTLGYILHLIEDAAVPDHTRDDPHAHDMRLATGDYGSPLEEYAKRYNRNNFNIADELKNNGYKPITLSGVDDHLVSLAKYSNGYFFSKDTINDPIYQNPKIVKEDGEFGYGKDKNGEEFELVKVTKKKIRVEDEFKEIKEYFLLENRGEEIVVEQYFTRLSREAIVHGAGVVDLFFKEAEAVILGQKQAPKLFAEEPKSVVQRVVALDIGLGNISATGEFFKIVNFTANAYNKTKETVVDVATSVVNLFSQKSNDELSAALEVTNLNNSENNADSNGSTSNAPPNVVYKIYQEDSGQAQIKIQDKIAVTEEALQVLQNQLLALQKQPPSRQPLDGGTEEKKSNAPIIRNEPRIFHIAMIYPGFGGGGDAAPQTQNQNDTPPLSQDSSSTSLSAPNLSVPQCAYSLSLDGCLLATTTVVFSWQSVTGADYYGINKNGEYSTTTELFFSAAIPDFSDYDFSVSAVSSATTSATTTVQTVSVATIPIAINEIAWMGTTASYFDEWMELKNNTGYRINLSQWAIESEDGAPYIVLSGEMSPYEYRILERRENTITARAVVSSYGNGSSQWALGNNGEELFLSHSSTTLDKSPAIDGDSWLAGENTSSTTRKTMERIDSKQSGATTTNWATWGTNVDFIKSGEDADGNQILGTPGECNSASFININGGQNIASSTTLEADNCYYISSGVRVSASSTLTIEEGAQISLSQNNLNVDGILDVNGSENNPVVFGSFSGDVTINKIKISGNSGTSTIDNAVISYTGGIYVNNSADVEITNTNFTNNEYGVELNNGSSANIENVTFASTTREAVSAYNGSSIFVASSTISDTLEGDAIGIYDSNLSMSSTTINTVYDGDGIGVYDSVVSIASSTISNIYDGDGIGVYDSVVSIASSTISNIYEGDGIGLYNSTTTISNVTVENTDGDGIGVYGGDISGSAVIDGTPVEF